MKKSLMMMVVMLITSTIIFAQHKSNGHHKQGDRLEKMKTELKLSDTQYATLKGIDEKYKTKRDALRKDSAQTREAKGNAFNSLRAEQQKEVDAVLTADQKATRDKLKAEHAAKRKEHFEKVSAERDAKLKETLSLNDDQAAKLKATNEQFREKLQALRKRDTKEKADFEKLKADHEAAVKAILTPDQFTKWTTLKRDKHKKHHGHHDRRG